mmetsp:Transcript_31375/g.91963  ORF Transcript_31375/g.91963 Transcript_31375/m.91963 type:complete len:332 (+) Transcript_31375:374-1369(+)
MVQTGLMDLEAVHTGTVLLSGLVGDEVGVRHEEQMGEGRTIIGPVDVGLPGRLGKVQAVTSGTEDVDGVVAGQVGQSDGKDGLALTKDVGTPSEAGGAVLLVHGVHPAVGDDVPGVDEPVQHLGGTLDDLLLLFGEGILHGYFDVEDHVEGVVVVGDQAVETGEVEGILDVVLVDLAEELVAAEGAEPRDPRSVLVGARHFRRLLLFFLLFALGTIDIDRRSFLGFDLLHLIQETGLLFGFLVIIFFPLALLAGLFCCLGLGCSGSLFLLFLHCCHLSLELGQPPHPLGLLSARIGIADPPSLLHGLHLSTLIHPLEADTGQFLDGEAPHV